MSSNWKRLRKALLEERVSNIFCLKRLIEAFLFLGETDLRGTMSDFIDFPGKTGRWNEQVKMKNILSQK